MPVLLNGGEVEVIDPVRVHVRQIASDVTQSERGRLAEIARVEPLIQPALRGAGKGGALAVAVRTRSSSEEVREV